MLISVHLPLLLVERPRNITESVIDATLVAFDYPQRAVIHPDREKPLFYAYLLDASHSHVSGL